MVDLTRAFVTKTYAPDLERCELLCCVLTYTLSARDERANRVGRSPTSGIPSTV
jgi:hypothetical protein